MNYRVTKHVRNCSICGKQLKYKTEKSCRTAGVNRDACRSCAALKYNRKKNLMLLNPVINRIPIEAPITFKCEYLSNYEIDYHDIYIGKKYAAKSIFKFNKYLVTCLKCQGVKVTNLPVEFSNFNFICWGCKHCQRVPLCG